MWEKPRESKREIWIVWVNESEQLERINETGGERERELIRVKERIL